MPPQQLIDYLIILHLFNLQSDTLAIQFLLFHTQQKGKQRQPRRIDWPVKWSSYHLGIYVSPCSAMATFTDKTIYLSLSLSVRWLRTESLGRVAVIAER